MLYTFLRSFQWYAACCGSFLGVGNILSLTDVITCRFAIKMSIGLQMRKARNLREIYSHLGLSENEVSRSALKRPFYQKKYNI